MHKTILTQGLTFKILVSIITLSTCNLCLSSLISQTVFWSEDFETNGTGIRYIANDQFVDALDGSTEDFFGRINHNGGTPLVVDLPCAGGANAGIDITNNFGSPSGNFYMAGEDMNDALSAGGCGSFNTGTAARSVLFSGININGASTITGRILVANGASDGCNTTNSRWDLGDGLKVFTNIDAAGENAVLCFSPAITCGGAASNSNEPLYTDDGNSTGGLCSGNGTDGTFVDNNFTEYTFSIPTGGTSLDLRIEISSNSGDSEIAFDNIRLEATTIPLPIKLISFNARKKNEETFLKWVTATETNNEYFNIEHSVDGQRFLPLGKIDGAGNSSEELNYSFMHNKPVDGVNYYRLKQVDYDGTYTYSEIQSVAFKEFNNGIRIAPNPFKDELNINLTSDFQEDTNFKVYDLLGQVVYNGVIEREQLNVSLNLADFKAGVYIVRIGDGADAVVERITKL